MQGTSHLVVAGAVLLAAFSVLAAVDGMWLHLWRYRLHTRRESYLEHVTHTLNALLFPPLVFLLLYRSSAGTLLWIAAAIVIADVAIESWDVSIERASRATLGGLTPFEAWIHLMVVTLRVGGITVLLVARPVAAWTDAAASGPEPPHAIRLLALALMIGGALSALQHLWYAHPRYRRSA